MSYSNNVPVQPQSLGNSRPLINGNFSLIDNVFAVDHIEFDDENGVGPGKHTSVHFPFTAAPTTAAGEIAVYIKTVSSISRLFMREPSNGTEQQISGVVKSGQGSGTNNAAKVGGICPAFGGFLIAWGFIKLKPQTSTPITFAAECGANFPTNCYVVIPVAGDMPAQASPAVTVTAVSATGCTLASTAATSMYFIAIGN